MSRPGPLRISNGHPPPDTLPAELTDNQAAFAAFEVLWRRGTVLHWRDIASQAPGTVAAKSIKAALYGQRFTHIFTKAGEGTFGLQRWPTEVPQTPEVSRAPGF
jgi:hypothetical protein